ncbi:hypothetical protein [Listeria phage LMTA-34]|uniref:Uncharacterized protein n=2 Tax=Pecentumvirus TaxID=1857844 RepID=A0A060AC14_9CAUD|nr:hypothetical protein HH39_gp067 [Listeria phage LMSP-25]YP_009616170.1 hypothetical protein FDI77_gp067 [Listeria phage LMTA-34]AIA64410.1 hypothetical protein [Listeria phage LMSP-25]AID16968.1 hypothetical protein [Listeria phage LMTA-34]
MIKEYYVKYSSQEKNNCSIGTYTEVEELAKNILKSWNFLSEVKLTLK